MRPGIFVGHASVDGDGEVIERLNKYCSHAGEKGGKRTGKSEHAVFLGLRFVSAQSQAAEGMLLRQSLAQTQKSSHRPATVFV